MPAAPTPITKPVTVAAAPNVAPVARITSNCSGLACSFFGTTSTDSDGTIAGYAWNFGDGRPPPGTPPHPYEAAGTYNVTLTVTDDDGATESLSTPVTVAPANPDSGRCLHLSTPGLDAVFGTTSTDSDGTIVGYAWTFGDGGTAPRCRAPPPLRERRYLYRDADGHRRRRRHQRRHQAGDGDRAGSAGCWRRDDFSQPVTNGFGTADVGGTWLPNSQRLSIADGVGSGCPESGRGKRPRRLPRRHVIERHRQRPSNIPPTSSAPREQTSAAQLVGRRNRDVGLFVLRSCGSWAAT